MDTAVAEDTAADRGRRTRRFAQTARKNALSRLSQAETVQFIARNATQSAEIAGVKSRGRPLLGEIKPIVGKFKGA